MRGKPPAPARKLKSQGIDPIDHRRAQRDAERLEAAKAVTFDQAAERFIAGHEAGWKNPKHRQQWRNTLATYVSPVIGALPVQDIDTDLVMKVLEPIWTKKPETAGRVRGRIESILDWAKAHKLRAGENPAQWRGHLDQLLPKKSKVRKPKHHAAMSYAEVPGFMDALAKRPSISAKALAFTILTAARTGEVIGAKWSEFDLKGAVWTIPEDRMKAGKEHRVPLAKGALAILGDLPHGGGFVFARDGRPLSNMAMLKMLALMNRDDDLTVHGFRSSFRDWAAERTNFARELAEAALAHAVGDETERAYQRGDLFEKRRRLMAKWADYCAQAPKAAGFVPLHRRIGRTLVEA